MKSFAIDVERLQTVVAAVLDRGGTILKANAGFLRLLPGKPGSVAGQRVANLFIQPGFAWLLQFADESAEGYRGLLTLGSYKGSLHTLHGHFWQAADGLRLLAEYEIDALERLNQTVLQLNQELSRTQQELARANVALRQREAQILESSLTDPLTGTGNRRRFEQVLAAEISRVARGDGELSAVMCDLDHFKAINDRHGHAVGDAVLTAFGALLRAQTRPSDCACRLGGEEFALLLPQTSLEAAAAKAEMIRTALAQLAIEGTDRPVTASFGVAQFAREESADQFVRRLDTALYAAKNLGRNRVRTAER